jgi:hypothetical protein
MDRKCKTVLSSHIFSKSRPCPLDKLGSSDDGGTTASARTIDERVLRRSIIGSDRSVRPPGSEPHQCFSAPGPQLLRGLVVATGWP